jgi:SAM-dependent methyltransferase
LLTTDRLEITRHLDIGCSAGTLLEAFVNAYGCQPVGVEPGEAYRNYAAGRKLTVYPSLEALEDTGEAPFDFISLAHVLEHLPDPVQSLAGLREKWLVPQGHLLVEVPNLYCHDSFEVAHLVSYSPQTLTQTLTRAGYRIIHLWTHGRPRSRLLPLYITALAVPGELPASQDVHPERWVALKRRAGLLHRGLLSRLLPRQAWLPAGQAVES